MFRVLVGAILLAASVSFAASHGGAAARVPVNEDRIAHAYAKIRTGMPLAQLDTFGFDPAKAERLSKKAVVERFMPKDDAKFDALNPAAKNCYRGPDDCTAYIFDNYSDQVVVLVQGGRVAWKKMYIWIVAGSPVLRAVA